MKSDSWHWLTGTNTYGSIDQLTYTYAANSNQLQSVNDAISSNNDVSNFGDGNTVGSDYEYWPDGSLKKDLNKGRLQSFMLRHAGHNSRWNRPNMV